MRARFLSRTFMVRYYSYFFYGYIFIFKHNKKPQPNSMKLRFFI
jgi:hypothetical protein